ncbi:MAG: hypothetical protein ACKORF_03780 [Micrococcales bacterium]
MQTKKILVSALVAAALIAGSGTTAATAAPVSAHVVTAKAVSVSAKQTKAIKKAVDAADAAGENAVLVTGYKKSQLAAAKAFGKVASKYIAAQGYDLEVVYIPGHTYGGLRVIPGTDDTTILLEVNAKIVHDGDTVNLPAGSTTVGVKVNVKSEFAKYEIDGATGLVPGDNILDITVTAADGTEESINIIVNVAE